MNIENIKDKRGSFSKVYQSSSLKIIDLKTVVEGEIVGVVNISLLRNQGIYTTDAFLVESKAIQTDSRFAIVCIDDFKISLSEDEVLKNITKSN